MLRKIALLAAAALAASLLVGASASAATPPPVGTLTCANSGSATFSQGGVPPVTPSPRNIRASGSGESPSCNATGVTGGSATINLASLTIGGTIPRGTTCNSLFSGAKKITGAKAKILVKNSSVDTRGHTHVKIVATLHPDVLSLAAVGNGLFLSASVLQNHKGTAPFGGETLTAQLNFDNLAAAMDCSNGTGSLAAIQWSAAGGSTLSIAPRASGMLICSMVGGGPLKTHPFPAGAPTRGLTTIQSKSTLGPCAADGVTGGSAVINGGTMAMRIAFNKGSSCATLFTAPLTANAMAKFQVDLENSSVNAFGFPVITLVARLHVNTESIDTLADGWMVHSKPITSGAFKGETAEMLLTVDNLAAVADCAAGIAPLTELTWTASLFGIGFVP